MKHHDTTSLEGQRGGSDVRPSCGLLALSTLIIIADGCHDRLKRFVVDRYYPQATKPVFDIDTVVCLANSSWVHTSP